MAGKSNPRKAPAEVENILRCVDRRQLRNWRKAAEVHSVTETVIKYRFERFTPTHAVELARIAPRDEWARWIEVVEEQDLTVRELRTAVVAEYSSIKPAAETACALEQLPRNHFRTLLVDPPWPYAGWETGRGQNKRHYPSMSMDSIRALPVHALAADQAHLHLWTTVAFSDEAKNLITHWGFEYKSELVWCKPGLGTGEYWRLSHEHMYLGVKGSLGMMSHKHRSWIEAPRARHSEKPEIVRKMIEEVSPPPRLEMFSRKEVEGWVTWGNQVIDR